MAHSSNAGHGPASRSTAAPDEHELSGPECKRESRRAIARKGFGVLEDGTTFPLSIVEISYAGCKIQTEIALFPGVQLKLSVVGGRAAVDARVRWHKDGKAGLEFLPSGVAPRVQTPRAHSRLKVDASVTVRRPGGRHYHTLLFDITAAGCKLEFVERPRRGDVIWAKFDGLEAIEASVAWVEDFRGGLKFSRPMHPATFDALVSRLTS